MGKVFSLHKLIFFSAIIIFLMSILPSFSQVLYFLAFSHSSERKLEGSAGKVINNNNGYHLLNGYNNVRHEVKQVSVFNPYNKLVR